MDFTASRFLTFIPPLLFGTCLSFSFFLSAEINFLIERYRSRPPSPWKESELLAGIFYYLIRELRKLISFNLPRTSRPFFLSLSLLSLSRILFLRSFSSPADLPFFIARVMLSLMTPRQNLFKNEPCKNAKHDLFASYATSIFLQNVPFSYHSSCILYSRMEI